MPPKLGEILICAKIIDQQQLESALSTQQKWGGKLGEILVNSGLCSEEMMVKALARQLDIDRAELDRIASLPPEILRKIPLELSRSLDVLPLELRDGDTLLVVAMSDPLNAQSLGILAEKTHCRIQALLAGPHAIARSRSRLYPDDETRKDLDDGLSASFGSREKIVVKGIPGYGKLINKEALGLSNTLSRINTAPPPVAKPEDQPALRTACPGKIEEGFAADDPFRSLQVSAHQSLNLLTALIDTLIEKKIFSREEFYENFKNLDKK